MNTYTKTCIRCNLPMVISEFHKDKSTPDGHKSTCKECCKSATNKWRSDNKEKVKEYKQSYNSNYYSRNSDKLKSNSKLYRQQNKNIINNTRKKYRKRRSSEDPLYKLTRNIGSLIRLSFSTNGFTKTTRTHEILGCSWEEFHAHIENQFMEGMSWDNRSEWHLDHITPVSWGKSEEEIIALNHYTNFQPLWAVDNIRKGNRFSG